MGQWPRTHTHYHTHSYIALVVVQRSVCVGLARLVVTTNPSTHHHHSTKCNSTCVITFYGKVGIYIYIYTATWSTTHPSLDANFCFCTQHTNTTQKSFLMKKKNIFFNVTQNKWWWWCCC